jgi:hypothetical protein
VDYGALRSNTAGRAGYIFELPTVRPIGVGLEGSPAFNIRVVVMPGGALKTAFPF